MIQKGVQECGWSKWVTGRDASDWAVVSDRAAVDPRKVRGPASGARGQQDLDMSFSLADTFAISVRSISSAYRSQSAWNCTSGRSRRAICHKSCRSSRRASNSAGSSWSGDSGKGSPLAGGAARCGRCISGVQWRTATERNGVENQTGRWLERPARRCPESPPRHRFGCSENWQQSGRCAPHSGKPILQMRSGSRSGFVGPASSSEVDLNSKAISFSGSLASSSLQS